MTAENAPDEALAGALASRATGHRSVQVKRFGTGSQHHVFEVSFANRAPVVARLNTEQGVAAMIGASKLSRLLRPLGVPLPEIIAEDLGLPFPHLVLQRLPGTDLRFIVRTLSASRLEAIAKEVAKAQRIAAGIGSAGRYGYAVEAADAPRQRWSEVLQDNLDRSRTRITAAGLFNLGAVNAVAALVARLTAQLDRQPAIPFLHDTTTKNVIVTPEGEFSGIVDVDDLCFGDPRYVTALTLASLIVLGSSTYYVEAWMKLAEFEDDKVFRLYVALFLVDFMSEHGQAFNGNQQPSSAEDRRRLQQLFAESLQRAAG
jgi:aminoglycoside phosphotransferase